MLTVGSLFAGIGGFDLGFERTGHMRTVWFCEQDPFCQRVLAKHWPGVPVYPDVRALVADASRVPEGRVQAAPGTNGERTWAGGEPGSEGRTVPVPVPYVDILCGGFPCQDISVAGRGEGLDGARSGLWSEYARLIRELRPRYVVVENVSALLARGMERVLGDLAACGYDSEWDCIPASAVGAPHRRDRVWLVAYPQQPGLEGLGSDAGQSEVSESRDGGALADPSGVLGDGCGVHARGDREGVHAVPEPGERSAGANVADAYEVGRGGRSGEFGPGGWGQPSDGSQWLVEPDVGRVAHGVPARVDRLRSLGNALVPQIAEWIGHQIVSYEASREDLAA